ncbi:solute carrier family 25 member 35-like [Diabrotica virgifera virgifera]|uniref:Solute carrier family 25 member 35-like n=1 Tax=Diabrotica virgifera virgifera TaxID=50390 RepID=A0A6P7FFA3_DIAVI|nr:solute carrier family 25 member 35-like [Diabrotica virgifera virgifera]XP_050504761.1 solute carrier family 25 member 35-like [Diabrotica virgifera virgifera]XP_050504762.1 solute carrier family 25 member 35-like [Diabrotica virgifera virgifera]XP_050504763.1 solute carrier family 25 member 35-like [Diabrotica virgifera virgifera]XP_050504764.1 solute carrier family 25 member 35-like [Diabrotica virgifera virgifera]
MDFVIGGLAASGAAIFSNPFDVVKTRMQLQGELQARGKHQVFYKNVFHAGWVIAKNEGIRGLQKGLGTAILMHSVRNSTRLGIYQWLHKKEYLTNEHGKTIFHRSALASAFSGAAGAFLGSPLFLVKTQLQAQAADNISVGTQHGHKGAFAAFRTIYHQDGISGLWRGGNAVVLRAVVGSSAQLTSFAITKDMLRDYEVFVRYPIVTSFVASIIGGVFQCILMNPFDLVSVRLYNQGVDQNGRGLLYNGIFDAFVKIGKKEGLRGFYKGVTASYVRLAPHGALCLVFWDMLKELHEKHLAKSKVTSPKFIKSENREGR